MCLEKARNNKYDQEKFFLISREVFPQGLEATFPQDDQIS